VAYETGSGTHAFAYLIELQDHLFQLSHRLLFWARLGYVAGVRELEGF
jgi:hypothetical protein